MRSTKNGSAIKKVISILSTVMVAGSLLIASLYIACMTPYVQTKLVDFFTYILERQTGAEITIGQVNFSPIESLVLEDVLVKDQRQDTLLYCKRLVTKIDSFSFVKHRFTITELLLEEAFFYLWIDRDNHGGLTNVEMLFESMPSQQKAGRHMGWAWRVNLAQITLKNSRFKYVEAQYEPLEYGINWTDVDCRDLNVTITGIDLSGGQYKARVSGLNLAEKSGFHLINLTADVVAKEDQLLITDGIIQTERSELHLDTLRYDWIPEQGYWREFTTRMQQYYAFSSSKVHFEDLAFFNEKLLGMNNVMTVSGVIANTVSRLEGHRLEIHLGEKSVLFGDFRSKGLPRFFDADFEVDFSGGEIVPKELEVIYMPWLDDHFVKFPEEIHRYGILNVEGQFRGKIEDFKLAVQSKTPGLRGDVRFALVADSVGDFQYGGDATFYEVDYGFLFGQHFLGVGSLGGKFQGVLRDSTTDFLMNGRIRNLHLGDALVRDIDLAIDWRDHCLDVGSWIDNDSLQAEMKIRYLEGDTLKGNATGFVQVRNWDRFGLELFGKQESFGFSFDGQYLQHDDGYVRGDLMFSNLQYGNERGKISVDSVTLRKVRIGNYGLLELNSKEADLAIEGYYETLPWIEMGNVLLQRYVPAYGGEKVCTLPDKLAFMGNVVLKKVDTLIPLLCPELKIANGTRLEWNFNDAVKTFDLTFASDTLYWNDFRLSDSYIRAKGDSVKLDFEYKAGELYYKRLGRLCNVRNTMSVMNSSVDNKLTWCNWEEETYSGVLSASLQLLKYRDRNLVQIFMNPGTIVMSDSVWHIDRALLLKDGDEFYVNNFNMHRNDQTFSLNGRVGHSSRDTLSLFLNNFDLAELNKLVFGNQMDVFGKVNGIISVSDFYQDRLVYSDVEVQHWGIGTDTLGVMEFHSFWDTPGSMLQLQVSNHVADDVPLFITGYYKPSSDSLSVMLNLSEINISKVTHYFPDFFKEGNGFLSGELTMQGTMRHVTVNGSLNLDSIAVILKGLNTKFVIDDRLRVKNSRVLFDDFIIRDAASKSATCSGYYDLNTNRYDVKLNFDDFMVLNTSAEQSEMFYGQLYISGLSQLENTGERHRVNLNLRTEDNSKLYVPLSAADTESDEQFLHFIDAGQPEVHERSWEYKSPLSVGVDLNANLEINDNLEVQIIFDPTIGDILQTIGRGDLKVSLNKDNQLELFGEYKIERGDYLFTLSNLVNKKFVLNQGGSIKWNGSPYDAVIDLRAVYHLKTSLNDLLASSNTTIDKVSKIPVECILNLSESLMNPSVKFDINFPSLDIQVKSVVQSLFASQDDINKQMFSLLILNKFYTPDYMDEVEESREERNAGYQAGVTTASELLSNQLSRWLSQISNNFDIGFSYRPGDQVTANEFELALSTQIFNNRVTLSANGNMVDREKANSNASITGDFDVDVKINKQGTLKLKAYSHTNEKITYDATETVQGIGISYQETFDTLRELFRKYFGFLRRKKDCRITSGE